MVARLGIAQICPAIQFMVLLRGRNLIKPLEATDALTALVSIGLVSAQTWLWSWHHSCRCLRFNQSRGQQNQAHAPPMVVCSGSDPNHLAVHVSGFASPTNLNAEPSTITNFSGSFGFATLSGMVTRTDRKTGEEVSLPFGSKRICGS